MRRICIVVLFAIISGILFQIIFHPALVYNLLLCGLAIILSFWKRWFLYVLIAWLSAINTSLHAPMRFSDVERDVVFSGVVIGEEPREHYVKLLVAIDGVEVDNKRIDYRNRVEFYTREQGTFLGNRLFIKGRITHAKYPNRPNILTGDVIKIDRECSPWGLLNLMRSYIHRLLKRLLNNEYYDVGMGLVLGGSGRITRDFFSSLRAPRWFCVYICWDSSLLRPNFGENKIFHNNVNPHSLCRHYRISTECVPGYGYGVSFWLEFDAPAQCRGYTYCKHYSHHISSHPPIDSL